MLCAVQFLVCGHCAHHSFSVSGLYFISVLLFMTETRSAVILTRMARQMRKDTGNDRYRARVEENRPSLASIISISCTRPLCEYIHNLQTFAEHALDLLFTEPTLQSFSVSSLLMILHFSAR